MQPIRVVTGTAVPLDRSDVDTDQIIPSDWLKRIERTGYGKGLFSEWRDDRTFVLNQEQYAGANILVAGPNFGTGSSREHAVWAIEDYGFKAVISPRFGDIFKNNCTKVGLIPVQVSPETGRALLDAVVANPTLEITIDVERHIVSVPMLGIEESFPMDDFTIYRLLNGFDDIGLTMRNDADISSFEQTRPAWAPSVSSAT
jgi:3-isopropylmalate/(R)-2-methylmalate dehydratase small subunit